MNFDWLPKNSTKWLGIVVGVGMVIAVLLPKMQCGGERVEYDTVYVTKVVPGLPDTVLQVKRIPGKPIYREDTRRVDSLIAAVSNKDSLIEVLLQEREGSTDFHYKRDSVLQIDGNVSAIYAPFDTSFSFIVELDTVKFRESVPPVQIDGLDTKDAFIIATSGAILGWFIAILAH